MASPLEGRRVVLTETRQLDELAALLEKEGAVPLRYPLVAIHDNPDAGPVRDWLSELIAGRFDYVVFMTGEGVRRLAAFAAREGWREAYVAALARATTVTRGPKPVQALKELGLSPGKVAPTPTTEGVIDALRGETLAGKAVGVQLFDEANPELTAFLDAAGARAFPVFPYVYGPACDDEKVVELIRSLGKGEIDVIAFTSTPQVLRLFDVAGKWGLLDELRRGLERACVAAVGPVAAESLRRHGARVDVCPEKGGYVMKKMVEYIKRALGSRAGG